MLVVDYKRLNNCLFPVPQPKFLNVHTYSGYTIDDGSVILERLTFVDGVTIMIGENHKPGFQAHNSSKEETEIIKEKVVLVHSVEVTRYCDVNGSSVAMLKVLS